MATFLVIGLGRFGTSLAVRLTELGHEVLAIDTDEETVNRLAPHVTQAKIGNCMDEMVLRALGVENFDTAFVCISEQFQSSLEITSLLKDCGCPRVVAKAERAIQARLLKKIGADEIVFPELDMAQRTAMRYSVNGAMDYIELAEGYAIFELGIPDSWVGKSLRELDIRGRFNVNIIGTKDSGRVRPITAPSYQFQKGEHILVAGADTDVLRMNE